MGGNARHSDARLYMIDGMEKQLASWLPKYEEAKRQKDLEGMRNSS